MSKVLFDEFTFNGSLWSADFVIPSLIATGTFNLSIGPSSATSIEAVAISTPSNDTTIEITEGGTFTGGVDPTNLTNKNRRSKLTAPFIIKSGTTPSGDSVIKTYQLFSSNQTVGAATGERLFLLDPDKTYNITLTNNGLTSKYFLALLLDSAAIENR